MKQLRLIIRILKTVCQYCHGMTTVETPQGDCIDCPVCKGKGIV